MAAGHKRPNQWDTDGSRSSRNENIHDVLSCQFELGFKPRVQTPSSNSGFVADQMPIAVPAASQMMSSAAVTPNS
jgi:hypothetical protein